ncbi:hypothetical protein [Deinococcus aluminii]|uniref:hypothetical protein n=1 Tax=Deinococcus aluminii TaxID=1656885 RepID=UPI0031E6EF20
MTNDNVLEYASTLFYKSENNEKLTNFLESEMRGYLDPEWSEFIIELEIGTVHLNKLEFAPGNKVAVTILKIYNFLKNRFGEEVREDRRVKALLEADYSIGIVFKLDSPDETILMTLTSKILNASSGVMFVGDTLLDSYLESID